VLQNDLFYNSIKENYFQEPNTISSSQDIFQLLCGKNTSCTWSQISTTGPYPSRMYNNGL